MTSGIVFILHGPSDASYAAELAVALSPHLAFPVALKADTQQRATQYGAGAVCVVLWTRDAQVRALANAVAEAMPATMADAVICRIGDAPLPATFAANAVAHVRADAGAETAAAPLLEAIARKQREGDERSARPRRAAPSLSTAAYQPPPAREGGKNGLVMRGAWGLAATMAVVGVVAPLIGDRAGAANIPPDQDAPQPETEIAATVAAEEQIAPDFAAAGEVVHAAHTPAPQPLDEPLQALVQSPPQEIPAAHEGTTLFEGEPGVADLAFAATQLDPKASQVIAEMVAGSDVSAWKIEAVAPLLPAQQEKPGAVVREARKPGAGA